jgi:ABC-type sulfate transport system permease component
MKADLVQEAGSADKRLEQAGTSTMRLGAILFLAGAGMMALMSLAIASESQTRDIGSSICLAVVILGVLRFLRGYREYQQGRRLARHSNTG